MGKLKVRIENRIKQFIWNTLKETPILEENQNETKEMIAHLNLQLNNKLDSLKEELDCIKVIENQNEIIEILEHIRFFLEDKYELVDEEISHIRNREEENSQLIIKNLMKVKWKQIDETRKEGDDDVLKCDICGNENSRKEYEKLLSHCIFNGGELERYICPQCGVIFGPTKFTSLSQTEIDEDYSLHYTGYAEGDSSAKELKAFYILQPSRTSIYLNYGCGCWSKSLQKLRQEGYQVYGYEPYAPEGDNPYMITSHEELSRMRFDGIFSNDLIEHFINPIEEFAFMKSLLKCTSSKMAHSTSCYMYKYAHTRFHTHFFTGRSIDVLCEKVGLKVIEKVDDMDKSDFICYVYQPVEEKTNYLPYMKKMKAVTLGENEVVIHKDGLMVGPYVHLGEGSYRWELEIVSEINFTEKPLVYKVTSECGKNTIKEVNVKNGRNVIVFQLEKLTFNIEFVLANEYETDIKIVELNLL